MVNKSPDKKKKKKENMSISQILDDFDIDEKYLRNYVKDGYQMNLTLHRITCAW